MGYFEEYLTLGPWLGQNDSRALYKYLLIKNKQKYAEDSVKLLQNQSLIEFVANGEIFYFIQDGVLKYKSRKIGSEEYTDVIREIKLNKFRKRSLRKMGKFFAQCEVDVIRNFPLPGANIQEDASFCFNSYPFYELNYYSNGKNRFIGLINKLKTDDSEILRKLSA